MQYLIDIYEPHLELNRAHTPCMPCICYVVDDLGLHILGQLCALTS